MLRVRLPVWTVTRMGDVGMASEESEIARGLVASIQELVAHRVALIREARSADMQGHSTQCRMCCPLCFRIGLRLVARR